MSGSPFKDLQELFPVWTIKNKTKIPRNLLIAGGDFVSFGPHAVRKIESKNLHQVPDSSVYTVVSPSPSDMIALGLIKVAAAPNSDSTEVSNDSESTDVVPASNDSE